MKGKSQIFGIHAITEAINSGKTIDKVFIQKSFSGSGLKELEKLLREKAINISYAPVQKLNRLTSKNHQGAIALISPIEFHNLETIVQEVFEQGKNPLFIILDEISDARNFGAIIRTAECTGVHAIIIPQKGAAPVNGDTIKTSAGAVFNLPICKVNHIKDAIYYLQGSGVNVVAATEKSNDVLYNIDFTKPTALIMGSEGKGVSASVLKLVDDKAKLPMFGEISYLNVSVACGALLYEIVRQRY
jgi:23S rRNA (guanosine2251-2'-O)-methyltransferase